MTGLDVERVRLWKRELGVRRISADEYLSLVAQGPHGTQHDRIMKDVDRTFKHDAEFQKRVSRGSLVRVLNAYAHKYQDAMYVQGMNVLAGVFLNVMPELDAFYAFAHFARNYVPTFLMPQLQGVHAVLAVLSCFKLLTRVVAAG